MVHKPAQEPALQTRAGKGTDAVVMEHQCVEADALLAAGRGKGGVCRPRAGARLPVEHHLLASLWALAQIGARVDQSSSYGDCPRLG